MNKKGQGLPLTTIIVAILVVVVLVVIVAFFLGGTTGLTNAIKRVFFGTTAGSDLTLAVETCKQYCDQAETYPSVGLQQKSAFCTQYFRIDQNRDGEADLLDADNKIYARWYCGTTNPKTFVDKDSGSQTAKLLGIPCSVKCLEIHGTP